MAPIRQKKQNSVCRVFVCVSYQGTISYRQVDTYPYRNAEVIPTQYEVAGLLIFLYVIAQSVHTTSSSRLSDIVFLKNQYPSAQNPLAKKPHSLVPNCGPADQSGTHVGRLSMLFRDDSIYQSNVRRLDVDNEAAYLGGRHHVVNADLTPLMGRRDAGHSV